uniref:F-box domain-containing protein n=1 Tax=Caenorhabditis tropicalis TaxID=1561998 RepID=A0A1I7TZE9_9PELO
MEKLPNELLLHILVGCNYADIICFRAIGNYLLGKETTFDWRYYNDHPHFGIRTRRVEKGQKRIGVNLDGYKMTRFMRYFPSITTVILAELPNMFSLLQFRTLSQAAPNIKKLVIFQNKERKWIQHHSLLGLAFYQKLENLKIEGWEPFVEKKKRGRTETEVLPDPALAKLTEFSIICERETVTKVLRYILSRRISMNKCVTATFYVENLRSDVVPYVMLYLQSHPNLQKLSFGGFLFSAETDVDDFYR